MEAQKCATKENIITYAVQRKRNQRIASGRYVCAFPCLGFSLTYQQGTPERQVFGCDRGCGPSQFELTHDAYIDQFGRRECGFGSKSVSILVSCEYIMRNEMTNVLWTVAVLRLDAHFTKMSLDRLPL